MRHAARTGSKYRNVRTNGYASKREAKRAAELKLLVKAGKIGYLIEQPRFVLVPKQGGERECAYVADFQYVVFKSDGDKTWTDETVVEDCKGMKTPAYVIKRKLMLHVHGIRVREV